MSLMDGHSRRLGPQAVRCRPRGKPAAGGLTIGLTLTLITLVACRQDSTPTMISPAAALPSVALAAAGGDSSWDRVDVDVTLESSLQPAEGKGKGRTVKRRFHAERGRGEDGRWYTRYTFPAGAGVATSRIGRQPGPDIADIFLTDDRTVVRVTTRDGQLVTIPPQFNAHKGVDLEASLSPELRGNLEKVSREIASGPSPRRSAHWLDAVLITDVQRSAATTRLQRMAGPPAPDGRGRPTYVREAQGRKAVITMDRESGDVEDMEVSDAAQAVLSLHVEHTRLVDGRMARSRLHIKRASGGPEPTLVTDIVLSNHRFRGGVR